MVGAGLPAPNADRQFANKLMVCADLVGGRYRGGGCWHAGRLFSTAPFAWGAGRSGSDQYVTIAGVASDDVAHMALYLATGERVAIPLHNNAYFVRVALAKYPLRLVAYDARDRVIGVKTVKGDWQARLRAQPVQGARWRTVIHNGAGDLTTAPSTDGGTCFAIRTPRAGGELSCRPRVWQGPPLQVGVGGAAGSAYVGGAVRADVARVVVRFEDGGSMTVVPVDGYVLSGVPRLHLRPGYAHGVAELEARDAAGRVVATRRLR